MSVSYYARAVVGIELPNESSIPRAIIKKRKKAFEHDYPDDGFMNFHPKDGRKLWTDEKIESKSNYPSILFDCSSMPEEGSVREGQCLISFPKGIEITYSTDRRRRFVGRVVNTCSSDSDEDVGFSKVLDTETLKESLRVLLEPVGLWDEDKFGIYSVLYCSY
jgi:hypothetical protein